MGTTTIAVCSALILMALITPLTSRFLWLPRRSEKSGIDVQPGVSVVIIAHDNAQELKENLPAILEQDYPNGYEVIVVVDKSTDGTDEILKQMCGKYGNLYTTFIPDSSRYMSRKKLAITIGVKAAKNEWILLTEAVCRPDSAEWLKTMARNCTEDKNLVIGYSNYNEETSSEYKRFERLHTEIPLMRKARKGTAYRTSCRNLMFRKDEFLKERGFEGNLKYVCGEYDFIVNKYAKKGHTAVETASKSFLTECGSAKKEWANSHIFYMETRKHLMRGKGNRLMAIIETTVLYLNYAVITAAATHAWITKNWITALFAAVALVATFTARTLTGKHAMRHFNTTVSAWKIPFFETIIPWTFIYYKTRYMIADKYDFISHKI